MKDEQQQKNREFKQTLASYAVNMLMTLVSDLEPIDEDLVKYFNDSDDPQAEAREHYQMVYGIDPILIQINGKHYLLSRDVLKEANIKISI